MFEDSSLNQRTYQMRLEQSNAKYMVGPFGLSNALLVCMIPLRWRDTYFAYFCRIYILYFSMQMESRSII